MDMYASAVGQQQAHSLVLEIRISRVDIHPLPTS